MPILAREPDLYPLDLFERIQMPSESETDEGWLAVYTLSRHEKELVRRLRALDVACYCPLIEQRTKSPAGRRRTSFVPLFSNYVFVYGSSDCRYAALTTNCVSSVIEVPDTNSLTCDLLRIHRLIESGLPLTPELQLQAGARVRIRTGPLQGLEGTLIRRRNENRLLLSVDFLQSGASVLLDEFQVDPID